MAFQISTSHFHIWSRTVAPIGKIPHRSGELAQNLYHCCPSDVQIQYSVAIKREKAVTIIIRRPPPVRPSTYNGTISHMWLISQLPFTSRWWSLARIQVRKDTTLGMNYVQSLNTDTKMKPEQSYKLFAVCDGVASWAAVTFRVVPLDVSFGT